MHATLFEFTVVAYDSPDEMNQTSTARVVALTPEQAAEIVLQERLRTIGPPAGLRARVWRLDKDTKPVITLLYR